MNIAPYLAVIAVGLIPILTALVLLKYAFRVPNLYPLTFIGIYILSGTVGLLLGNNIPYVKFLLPPVIFSILIYKKYRLTKTRVGVLIIIIALVNWLMVMYLN